jgi:epoxyqueuosine reductase
MGNWVFGCDICQEVCPYTRAARRDIDSLMQPASIENAFPSLAWLLSMSESDFRSVYRGTPVLRTKRRGLARNAAIAFGNIGTAADLPSLARFLAEHDEPLVRGHLAWAIGRLGGKAILDRQRSREPDGYVRSEIEAALAALE